MGIYQRVNSSIEGGGTSAFFQILAHGDTGTFFFQIFENCMLGNFLATICWETFWQLYAGNLLMETRCWEIRVDTRGFLKGAIMAQSDGIILRFQGNGTWSAS